MSKPKHFTSSKNFSIFILECAISDRITYLDAISKGTDEDDIRWQNETRSEIDEMKIRLKKLKERG